ncbi:MAG: hypothetical protein ACD_75C00458G0002, partial [uncultured bacterium]
MNTINRFWLLLSIIVIGIVAVSSTLSVPSAYGADHYNLEPGIPVQLEDSLPTPYRNREIQGLFRWEQADDGDDLFLLAPRLEYGLLPNGQMAIDVPFEFGSAVEEEGLGDIKADLLYNFNQESVIFPALSLASAIAFPTSDDSDGIETKLTFIASKTVGRSRWQRIHLNASWHFNDDSDDEKRRNYYSGIIGYDVVIIPDLLLVLDFIREQQEKENHEANIFEAGLRYQLTPLTVLALGTGAGIGDESPDFR